MDLNETFVRQFASAFQRLTEDRDDAAIVCLGVHSDTDATGLVFAAQSRRSLEQQLAAYPDYPSDAIWSIGDWDIHLPAEVLGTGPEGSVNEAVSTAGEELGHDIGALRDRVGIHSSAAPARIPRPVAWIGARLPGDGRQQRRT